MYYEQKYKEALERAKEIIECSKPDTKEVRMVLSFFPELKESDGDMIKKAVIDVVETLSDSPLKVKMLAWLKKQGEQKPTDWSEEDEKILSDIIKDLVHPWNEFIPDRIEDEIKWLKNRFKSLKGRYTWKPSKEQMEAMDNVIKPYCKGYGWDETPLGTLYNKLKELREE